MDDLIDRQGAIDTIGKMQTYKLFEGDDMILIDRAEAHINLMLLPSAERKGKWIYLDGLDAFECSVCGRRVVRNIFDYCPWCGSRNREERKCSGK